MRFKELLENEMTDAQKEVYRAACASPRGRLGPPTNVLLRNPHLAKQSQKVGDYVRFQSGLPRRISEFAIIITARYWTAQYEWFIHCPLAIKAGLSTETAAQLAQGLRPTSMTEDEVAAYDFCMEMHQSKEVSDTTYHAAIKHFGEEGMVDLIGTLGYYTLISMCLNVNQVPLPPGATPLPYLSGTP